MTVSTSKEFINLVDTHPATNKEVVTSDWTTGIGLFSPPRVQQFGHITDLATVFGGFLICLILLGNGTLLWLYVRSSQVRSSMSIFLFNLLVVDLLNGCISLPVYIFLPRYNLHYPDFGVPSCVLAVSVPPTIVMAGLYAVLLVTVERFVTVWKPFTYRSLLSPAHCVVAVVTMWVSLALLNLWPLLTSLAEKSNEGLESYSRNWCHGYWAPTLIFSHLTLALGLAVPLVIIVILFIVMYIVAHRHHLVITDLKRGGGFNMTSRDTSVTSSECRVVGDFERQVRKVSKAAKTTFILCGFYLLCWGPYMIIVDISTHCWFEKCPVDLTTNLSDAIVVAAYVTYVNASLNPFIYLIRNTMIIQEFRRLVFCCTEPNRVDNIGGDISVVVS